VSTWATSIASSKGAPRRRRGAVRELVLAYTPTDVEIAFVTENARQPAHWLTFRSAVFVPIDWVGFEPYAKLLLSPYKRGANR
jgi:hypothetical protein